ncbi:MAG: DUF3109 family protein [Bacteroidetes bacterium]|nr:DUF3109 family protein [Bacteroidota bacterium]
MIIVGQALISENIIEKKFVCNVSKCLGKCCVEGDRGAPLEESEIDEIEKNIEKIKPFMDNEGLKLLSKNGFFEIDPSDNEYVTTCRTNGACVFAVFENNIAFCAIEKSFENYESDFIKPISCHLYPIRVSKYGDFINFNFNEWDICKSACTNGNTLNIQLFKFLKNSLIRKMGEEWYNELEAVADEWIKSKI